MTYFCVDCEASGLLAPIYNLLSVGITVVRPADGRHHLGESYYAELKPIFDGIDPEAVAVCGLDIDRLRREGKDPAETMAEMRDWVIDMNRPSTERPVFVGHNAVFDWAYIAYYFAHFGMENPFGYKGIDTKSMAMGRLNLDWNDTSKENLERILGLPPQDPARIHRADYDARYQALILQRLLDMPIS